MTRHRHPRALVVAYDFPPHAAIGTMRTLRVVQRLAQEGWDVTVLTSDPRTFRNGTPVDETLLARVPGSVRVVRAGVLRGVEKLKAAVRGGAHARQAAGSNIAPAPPSRRGGPKARSAFGRAIDLVDDGLAIPDHESGWVMPAIARGVAACRRWRPDVLYSSAPPWTGQIVARALAGALRCPWVADFRDPWARAPWREARREFVRRANNRLERMVVHRASAILFVTRGNLGEFTAHYGPDIGRRFELIPSGCDPEEFEAIAAPPPAGRFVLLHAGSLYGARNPLPLIHAVRQAIDRGRIDRDRFRLRFVGPINLDVDLAAECRRLGLNEVVEFVPRVVRSASLREMVAANALLLVQPVTLVSVPGKAYEYLAAGRPLLALAEEGETSELVRASGIGVSVRPDAGVEAIEAALLELIGIASSRYTRPPASLYDGRVHAGAAVRVMERVAFGEGQAATAVAARRAQAPVPLQPEEHR